MSAADKSMPRAILEKAEGIAVFPSMLKGGFVVGGEHGRGILSVRDKTSGAWSSPAFLTITGGSIGAQIGGQSVDLILVVNNQRGLEQLVSNQFKIGANASVAAGPIGPGRERRDRHPDARADPQLLTHARAVRRRQPERHRPSARIATPTTASTAWAIAPGRSCSTTSAAPRNPWPPGRPRS